jgi:hypothetical protein
VLILRITSGGFGLMVDESLEAGDFFLVLLLLPKLNSLLINDFFLGLPTMDSSSAWD